VLGLDIGPEAADLPGHEGRRRDRRSRPRHRSGLRWDQPRGHSAPRCFGIEERLREELDIPVFHDDQLGTAVVVLASFLNALRVVGKRPEDVKVVISGVGAAGVATTKILLMAGVQNVIGVDRHGALWRGDPALSDVKSAYAELTNPGLERGGADDVLAGADVYIGLSAPGAVSVAGIRAMADRAVVFAMANPTPRPIADGRIRGGATPDCRRRSADGACGGLHRRAGRAGVSVEARIRIGAPRGCGRRAPVGH
jgi:hypothetical protein